jgi:hypothetical protein
VGTHELRRTARPLSIWRSAAAERGPVALRGPCVPQIAAPQRAILSAWSCSVALSALMAPAALNPPKALRAQGYRARPPRTARHFRLRRRARSDRRSAACTTGGTVRADNGNCRVLLGSADRRQDRRLCGLLAALFLWPAQSARAVVCGPHARKSPVRRLRGSAPYDVQANQLTHIRMQAHYVS